MYCVRVIVQNFGCWSLHYVNIVFICACIIFQMNDMIWHEFLGMVTTGCVLKQGAILQFSLKRARLA